MAQRKVVFENKKFIVWGTASGELDIETKGASTRGVRPEIRINTPEPGEITVTARGCYWYPGKFGGVGGFSVLVNIEPPELRG